MVKLGTVAIDGTKVKASASRHKAMSYRRMVDAEAELKEQIAQLMERARQTDVAERDEPELDLPAEIERRADRLEVIQAARKRLEARQREADRAKGGWLQQFLRNRGLAELTRDEIAAIGARKRAESSNATANRYLALIRAILRKAGQCGASAMVAG